MSKKSGFWKITSTLLALFISASPGISAMEDREASRDGATPSCRQPIKRNELTSLIRTKVEGILENFRRNMEAYYQRTRAKKVKAAPAGNLIPSSSPQEIKQVNYQSIPGAYESSCIKIKLSDEVTRELRTVICHGGGNPKGTILVKQNLEKAGLFFHDQKVNQYHISVAFMEPNHNQPLQNVKNMTDYYQQSLQQFSTIITDNLKPSYQGHVNHDNASLNGVWMFINGYDQQGHKITRHYPAYKVAKANIHKDFTFTANSENLCSAVSCHYVLRIGTSPARQCDGKAGPLTNDINALTQEINDFHESRYWFNPYKGIHDDFLGHLTVGVAKVKKGRINADSQKFQPDHLSHLLAGYEKIQECFEWKNSNGDVQARNKEIQRQNQEAQQQYDTDCQKAFDAQYQAKVDSINAHNRNPATAAQKITNINQQAIRRNVRTTIPKPKMKNLQPERTPVNVFKDLPMDAYVMETTFADGTKTTQALQGTKK